MFKNILKGLYAYKDSFKLINELKLWQFFFVPMAVSLFFAVTLFFTAYSLSNDLGSFFARAWIWEWGKETMTEVASWLGGIVILILGFIIFKHMVMALSAPFMSPVSERIEKHYYSHAFDHAQHRNTSNMQQLWRSLRINLRNLIYEIAITIPLLLLSFIPLVGIFFTVLIFFVQAYYAGFGNMDYTLERHFNYKESVGFVKSNKGIATGIGMVFIAMLFIPVVGVILVLPFSVTASTRATLDIMK
jgi:CysZ protein